MTAPLGPASDPDLDHAMGTAANHDVQSDGLGVGVIGYGYWGPNLVRNFAALPDAHVAAVSDLQASRLRAISVRYPAVRTTTDYRDLFRDPRVEAIVVATPASTHYELACEALTAGKHVLVEKPLAESTEQAERLIELADSRGLVLMVDHTFVYTASVQKIKQLVDGGELGRLYYWDSMRVNLGLFQHDVSVIADLAVHDLAIMDYVMEARPVAVAATGIANVPGQPVNTAYVTCYFESNLIAHFHVNWLAPVKVRRSFIGGDRRMIVYDDIEPSEKVKVYDCGITLTPGEDGRIERLVGYRTGDMWAPRLRLTEALGVEARHFVECIRERHRPITDGMAGLRVARLLEAAASSLADRGRPVELKGAAVATDSAA